MSISSHRLKEVCIKITDGTHHSPPIVEEGVPYVTAKHIKPEGIRFFDKPWFVSEEDHEAIYARCDPKIGDVLYIKDGATTGIAAVNEYDFPFSMLSSVALLRPDVGKCLPQYLCRWLNSPIAKDRFIRRMGGAAIKRLTLAKIKEFPIPLPPLAEQKRIAGILDAADALRAKRRESLAQLDTLLQSTFLDLFGDPVTNSKSPVSNLGEHLTFITSGGRGWAKYYSPQGDRFIRSLDVQMNAISEEDVVFVKPPDNAEAKRTKIKCGDVLLTITGSRIGRVAAVPKSLEGGFISQHVAILRPDSGLLPIFLSRYLSMSNGGQKQIASMQYGQTKPGLNFRQIGNFRIPIPSISEQKRFATIVESVERQKARQRAHLAELDTLFASLQARAFRGEL